MFTMSKIRVHLVVSGRVQGVGFRYFCDRTAVDLGITGWVRNESDGTVELEIQGDETQVVSFLTKIKKGPTLAYVSSVRRNDVTICPDETSFAIEY